jgi:hypothetical protein
MSFDEDRSKFLGKAIDNMLVAHLAYTESDSEAFTADDPLWDRIDELVAVFAEGSIPADMRPSEAIVSRELSVFWAKFLDDREMSLDPIHHLPGNGLWSAIKSLRNERQRIATKAVTKRPEPIAELLAANVSFRQIAIIWGWRLPDGEPDVSMVREEIASPGIHTLKWVDPNAAKADAERERQRKIAERIQSRESEKTAKATAKPPESIKDLIGQEVSATQIAKIHHCTIADVWAEADRLGLPRPPEHYTGVQHSRTAFEEPVTPEQSAAVRRATGDTAEKRKPGRPRKDAKPSATAVIDEPAATAADTDNWGSDDASESVPEDPNVTRVHDLYTGGKSIDEIAEELNMTADQVDQLLDKS